MPDTASPGPSKITDPGAAPVGISAPQAPSGSKREGASAAVVSEGAKAAALAAIAAAKEAASMGMSRAYNKVAMTDTRRFAGKDIQVCVCGLMALHGGAGWGALGIGF